MLAASAIFLCVQASAENNSSNISPGNGSDIILNPTATPDPSPDPIVDSSDTDDDAATDPSPSPTPDPRILIQGNVFDSNLAPLDQLVPIAGATIFFVNRSSGAENITTFMTVSDPTGFYSILLEPGTYTMISSAPGFESRLEPIDVIGPVTRNIILLPIPFNGFIAYAVNPVLETSPGRDITCTIAVANSQVTDQMVTFSVVTPPGWVAWFPQGEALLVPSGQGDTLTFNLRYTGAGQGPHTVKVVVNGGAYFVEIPVIAVVKDLPAEYIDIYTNSDCHTVAPGIETYFQIYVVNTYQRGQYLKVQPQYNDSIMTVRAWDFDSNELTDTFYVYREYGTPGVRTFRMRVYVSDTAPDGVYPIKLVLCGEGVSSNALWLHVVVNRTKLLNISVLDKATGNTIYNNKKGPDPCLVVRRENRSPLNLSICAKNEWDFPLTVNVRVSMLNTTGTAWPLAIILSSGIQSSSGYILPGQTEEFFINSTIPSGCISDRYKIGVEVSRTDLYWTTERKELIPIIVEVTNSASVTVCYTTNWQDKYALPDWITAIMIPAFLLLIILWTLYRWPKR